MSRSIRSRGTARRNGETVHLRAKTFHLLQYLVEQRHRLVRKEELLAYLWKDKVVTDATLVGCIQEIRRALGDDAKTPKFIKTAPRLGYQFIAPVSSGEAEETETREPPPDQPALPPLNWKRILAATLLAAGLTVGVWRLYTWQASAKPQPRAEVAWWKFDEGKGAVIADSSGNNLIGRINTPVNWDAGVLGGAIRLDGVTTAITGVDNARALPLGIAPRTLTAWVKTTSTNGDMTRFVNYTAGANIQSSRDNFQLFLVRDGRVGFGRNNFSVEAPGREHVLSTSRIDDGRWHLIAGSYTGAPDHASAIFVDGVEHDSVRMPFEVSEPQAPAAKWSIGNGLLPGTPFRGLIDEVRIYAKALRPAAVAALYRCSAGIVDLEIPGRGKYFYIPVFSPHPPIADRVTVSMGAEISNVEKDFAGVQLGKPDGACGVDRLRGADIGQDMYISVELLAPGEGGFETQAGPYFRSRSAEPGQGLQGGTSAGFWVKLHSTGSVTVRRLNPIATVAFTQPDSGFNPSAFHRLEVAANGRTMQAALDGKLLTFDQGGSLTAAVALDPVWEKRPNAGFNQGAAGIAFSAEGNRMAAGGQRARNLQILPYQPIVAR